MSKTLRTLLCVLLLSSCGVSYNSAPRNMDNACSILSQRPGFHSAFQSTKKKWGVPVHVQMATIHQESKFIGNAKTPMRYFLGIIPRGRQSSAYGYAQALDGTWNDYRKATGRFGARRVSGFYQTNCRDFSQAHYLPAESRGRCKKGRSIRHDPVWLLCGAFCAGFYRNQGLRG